MLLRHAKSSWDQVDVDDVDRPLAPRGRSAATLLGRFISRKGLEPELVLCSSATRARQTWEMVAAEWDQADQSGLPRLEMRASLYLASVGELFSTLRRIDDDVAAIMIIGHNPGMEQMARRLVSQGDPKGLKRLRKKFPTAALAAIDLPIESWSTLKSGQGELQAFIRPKDLK
jgi:phosphohistidine phosphatase